MPRTTPQPSRFYRVLVVEDEGLIAHDIASRLEALGHAVVATVSTAEQAISEAPNADIVLMDIHIDGDRDGIAAASEIRARYHLPVVFLTAHADRSTLERAKPAGPFGYLVKPLRPASLQTGIEMAVYKHGMERRLEEQEAWLRTSLEAVTDAVAVTDPRGIIETLNPAAERLCGWTQAEAAGRPAAQVLRLIAPGLAGDEPDAEADRLVSLALLRDAAVEFDRSCRLISKGGGEISVEGTSAPVKASREMLGVVMTFRDVSARRWEEKQLRQAQSIEVASRLAAGASSDYANLIMVIRNRSEQLLERFAEYLPARTLVEEIHQAAAAAERITRRLAAFGTRQTGQRETFSLNSLLRRSAKLIRSVAGERIQVTLRPATGAGEIHADTIQMEQAILNLVIHACSTMPEQGRILIETGAVELPQSGRPASYIQLAINYTGVEAAFETLFDLSTTAETGLALPVAHSVITECGGYLSVQPGPHGGSRLEVLLPRAHSAGFPPPGAGEPQTILMLEERTAVRSQLHNFFEAAGYNLLEASDPNEAIALGGIHEGSLDLLVAASVHAEGVFQALQESHPALQLLRMVDRPESAPTEIERPFTQQALLEKVRGLLGSDSGSKTLPASAS